ncbi:MAG: UDP-galactose-lipid carrier transferase [Thermoanaerobaculia bacterium]
MLEALDLSRELSKIDYHEQLPELQRRLHQLQRSCWEEKLATIVVLEGWDASGKGSVISKITRRLEPRGFSLHAIREPRTFESLLPWMWRLWAKLPNWGEIAIFDHSWYSRVLDERVDGLIEPIQWTQAYNDITAFEQALVDDRYLLAKFFLHIDKKEQAHRLKELESDPRTSWQVAPEDWAQNEQYDEYRVAVEEMLERTETEWGPWTLVAATDHRWTRVRVLQTIIEVMEEGLERPGLEVPGLAEIDDDEDDDGEEDD